MFQFRFFFFFLLILHIYTNKKLYRDNISVCKYKLNNELLCYFILWFCFGKYVCLNVNYITLFVKKFWLLIFLLKPNRNLKPIETHIFHKTYGNPNFSVIKNLISIKWSHNLYSKTFSISNSVIDSEILTTAKLLFI